MSRFWAIVATLVMVVGISTWDYVWSPLPGIGIAGTLGYYLGYWTKR